MTCEHCGNSLPASTRNRRFCNRDCYRAAAAIYSATLHPGLPLTQTRDAQRKSADSRKTTPALGHKGTLTCDWCERPFEAYLSKRKRAHKFCCQSCATRFQRWQEKETRAQIYQGRD